MSHRKQWWVEEVGSLAQALSKRCGKRFDGLLILVPLNPPPLYQYVDVISNPHHGWEIKSGIVQCVGRGVSVKGGGCRFESRRPPVRCQAFLPPLFLPSCAPTPAFPV